MDRHTSSNATARRLLISTEERMRFMLDSVRDYAIFMLDPDGYVQTWNSGAQRTKGYTPEEIIGQHFSRFYLPEERAAGRPQALLRAAAQHGRVEDLGWRVRKDGTRFWADVVLSAIRDDTGELIGYAKVTRDLTERRAAEEALRRSEERFRMLVESVRDYAIFMLDPDGRVATWNQGAERIKGYHADEIVGRHFSVFYPPEVPAETWQRELEVAAREGRFEDEGWRLRKDGTRFWANVVVTALRDPSGRLVGYAKVTRDLTDRQRAEEERVRLSRSEEAVRLRDEFLSIAAHELKTPLTALRLQLQSLAPHVPPADARGHGKVERATRSADRLNALIEALLDVSRLSTGRFTLHRERHDLSAVVAEQLERAQETAEHAGCPLEAHLTPGLEADVDLLRVEQVLANLLSNAFRYAAGTPVRVTLAREGDEAVLEVADGGPGIPAEALTRIFERFERFAPMRHYGGLGLGLYVARQIAEAHGGRVRARNRPEGGAAVELRLPLRPAGGAS